MTPAGPAAAPGLAAARAWALAAGLTVALAGLWPDLGDGDAPPRLDAALGWLLLLAAGPLPAAWAALAPDPAPGAGPRARLAARGAELALLVAAAAPALALAAPFSALAPDRAAAGLLHAAGVLACAGAWLALGREARATRVALLLLGGVAAPLLALALRDLLGARPAPLPWLAPPLAQEALLAGPGGGPLAGLGPALLGAALLPGLALLAGAGAAWRARAARPAAAALLAALAAAGVAPAAAEPRARRVEPLLPEVARDGAAWPVWVEVDGGAALEVAARSLGLRVAVAARPGERALLPAVTTGGARRVALEAREAGAPWAPLEAALAPARAVRAGDAVVGVLGERARPLAASLARGRRAHVAAVAARDLEALAGAGDALDLLVVARGALRDAPARAAVAAFAAAGGVVALDGREDLERLCAEGVAAPALAALAPGAWDARPLGAGLAVGPTDPLGLDVPGRAAVARLFSRGQARARRAAVEEAALAVLAPGPNRAAGRRVALAALGGAAALLLLSPLVARLAPGAAAGGALAAGLALAALLGRSVAPGHPAWAASVEVLELPAGAVVAARHEVVAVAAPRPAPARLRLAPGPARTPPRPVLATPAQAEAEVLVTLGADEVTIDLVAAAAPRAFARLEAAALAGPVRVDRGPGGAGLRVENGAGLALEGLLAVSAEGVHALGPLGPGEVLALARLPDPEPLARWRLGAATPAEARARRVVDAVLAGRDPGAGLVLVGRAPAARRLAGDVAAERAEPTLVVVTVAGP